MITVAQTQEIKESSMNNNSSSSRASSKLGRKGDPRMHRAVSARLASPDISLFEALRIGGFDYPTNDDASVMDCEKVTLGQRKNQLSRRLRLARKQNLGSESPEDDPDGSSDLNGATALGNRNGEDSQRLSNASASSNLSMEAQKELQKLMQHSRTSKISASNNIGARALQMKRECAELGLSDDDGDPEATTVDLPQEEPPRKRIAKFHPDYSPLFVPPPASSVRHTYNNLNTAQKANAANFQNQQAPNFGAAPNGNMAALNLGANAFGPALGALPQPSLFTQQISNAFTAQQAQQPRASAVAISSLSSSAQAVGMTLEQLAMTLASNSTHLAKIIAEGNGGDALAKQQELALHLHETEAKALYSKCLLLAGIDPRICQPNSPTHLQFALKAWQAEGRRLHDLIGSPRGIAEPPLNFGNEKATGKSSHNDCSSGKQASGNCCGSNKQCDDNHKHDHNHSHNDKHQCDSDSGRCDAQHVHRLDGQCGHKAIIHQPKDGSAHIDFVIGSKVECYHGIEPLGKNVDSVWPSKYKCKDYEECCSNKCVKNDTRIAELFNKTDFFDTEPRIIQLSEVNLQDPEWNYDLNGTGDGGVMGLLKLGERSDDTMSNI